MNENIIKKGNVTLIVSEISSSGKLELESFQVDSLPDTTIDCGYRTRPREGARIAAYEWMKSLLVKKGEQEKEQYLADHLSDYSVYSDPENRERFWEKALGANGDMPAANAISVELDYSKVGQGIVGAECCECEYTFDFIKGEMSKITNRRWKKDVSALELYYGCHELKMTLALTQLAQGKGHKALAEIIAMNRFLADKKSVKLNLVGFRTIELKLSEIRAYHILGIRDGKFYVNNNYYMKPRPENEMPIEDLISLQFGKSVHNVNVGNFIL